MATFDQLSADQRAILELVLKRGQSYEDLSGMLGMPEARVRELARTALVTLAPLSAEGVDSDWRGQLGDYVLGQQTGPESTATRGHLRRSEAARTWTRSLLDSLEDLYEGDGMPAVPDGDRAASRERRPRRRERERRPRRERERAPLRDEERDRHEEPAEPRDLSPEARSAVRRRRLLGAGAAAAALLVIVLFVPPIKVVSRIRDDDKDGGDSQPASQRNPRLVGRTDLRPVEGGTGTGVAVVAERGRQRQLIVQASLKPTGRREAYEVWLYNSDGDAKSIGAQVTDRQGTYQGAGPLPSDFARFKFIDISRETIDRNPRHSGASVLRAPLEPLKGRAPSSG